MGLLRGMCLHFSLVTLLIVGFNVPQSADIVALGNGLGHVKAGIKAAADAVVIFRPFPGCLFRFDSSEIPFLCAAMHN